MDLVTENMAGGWQTADNHWLHPQDPSWGWRVSTLSVNATKNHAAGEGKCNTVRWCSL